MPKSSQNGFFYSLSWMGIALLCAATIGAIALLEFRAGPILAGLLSLVAYGFLAYGVPVWFGDKHAPKRDTPVLTTPDDPRVDLLVEAHQHVKSLVDARAALPLPVSDCVNALALEAGIIINAVTEEPAKLTAILRFFTYYLPSTADLVSDRIKLAPHAGAARLAEIDNTLTRLQEAFGGFKAAVIRPDLHSVDLDISLLDDALDADLEDLKTR